MTSTVFTVFVSVLVIVGIIILYRILSGSRLEDRIPKRDKKFIRKIDPHPSNNDIAKNNIAHPNIKTVDHEKQRGNRKNKRG